VEPIFEWAESFHDGLALVKTGGKWGFIDNTGKMVIEPQFDQGLFPVPNWPGPRSGVDRDCFEMTNEKK